MCLYDARSYVCTCCVGSCWEVTGLYSGLAQLWLLVETSWCVAWRIYQTFWTHSEIQISLARIFSVFIFLDLELYTPMFYCSHFQRQEESCARIQERGAQVEREPAAWLASHCLAQSCAGLFIMKASQKMLPLCHYVV